MNIESRAIALQNAVISILLRLAVITSPLWAPLLAGYSFMLYGLMFGRVSKNISEGGVALAGVTAFIAGIFAILLLPIRSWIIRIIVLIPYLCIAPVIIYFSGWAGMLIN
ncbi:hypothetical protein OU800_08030 [Pseudomonas sp. GOM7]|uniref:hypothetical protein n=1 Tax=Pseudomonas sp. GOM7 TaxID=2998079 RepID=UPI00227A263D|nr:hypothetical protein [Pseudomonas sp. GOM7]WAJ39162.1 hypothetical protein OU800_08030 [Pseudomonas sp. GOM7]